MNALAYDTDPDEIPMSDDVRLLFEWENSVRYVRDPETGKTARHPNGSFKTEYTIPQPIKLSRPGAAYYSTCIIEADDLLHNFYRVTDALFHHEPNGDVDELVLPADFIDTHDLHEAFNNVSKYDFIEWGEWSLPLLAQLRKIIKETALSFPSEQLKQSTGMSLIGGQRGEILPSDSEENIAGIFAARHYGALRYVAAWGKWFIWDGLRWHEDSTLHAFDLARAICREIAGNMDLKAGRAIASAKTVAAIERLAKADRGMAATIDQWDADPMLLNTPGGIVDLRTGKIRPANPENFCTKTTAVAPRGECPAWHGFLCRVTGGDIALMEFLQRFLGYSLTGLTTEHALFFLYGLGANGKSVLLSTVSNILGDYHTTAPIQTFTASQNERHPTDLAGLRGARLVTATETESGHRWDEAKIKALTGGDKIAARFMRQDFFEFFPQFKLVIAGNHKPTIRSVDEAMRRRINLVPFLVTIPLAERDPTLTDKLRAEWPGILAWLIQGCLKWQASGLQAPDSVRNATADYLAGEDVRGTWLEDKCEQDAAAWTAVNALFADWQSWALSNGEYVGSQKTFSERLVDSGFAKHKDRGVRGFRGIRLKQPRTFVSQPPMPG